MTYYGEYLYKKVKVICFDGKEFVGEAVSFGGRVQGEEEYGRAEDFICVYTGDCEYILFEGDIKEIVEL